MKKSILSLSVLLLLLLGAFMYQSCNNEEQINEPNDHLSSLSEKYNIVGIKHNEALEYFYKNLREVHRTEFSKKSGRDTKNLDYANLIETSMENFMKDNGCSMLDNTMRLMSDDINPAVLNLQEDINQAINQEFNNKNLSTFKKELDNINAEATNTLTEDDAIAIYAGTSTALNSYLYWSENSIKWYLVLNYPEITNEYTEEQLDEIANLLSEEGESEPPAYIGKWLKDKWGQAKDYAVNWWNNGGQELVAADAGGAIEGAIGGAIGGAITGGTATAGPGAIPGAITGAIYGGISAGAFASLGHMVEDAINN
ncbi:hypothetical protein LJC06_03010 [Bacteroidales bacterium OttesenSCG-928-I14]|nr:hypothetical protein [Bacteroidales bacterium OttesenSCG-928-I14]